MESAFQGFGLAGLCGKCFRPVSNEVGGYILSCSDFLCSQCASNGIISDCPACGKCRVHLLDLKKELPDEVGGNLMDPIEQLGRVVSNAKFQIKYYKLTIRKLLSKLGQLNRENGQLKSRLKQGNQQLQERERTATPFFEETMTKPSMNSILSNPFPTLLWQENKRSEISSSLLTKRPATSQFTSQQQGKSPSLSARIEPGSIMQGPGTARPARLPSTPSYQPFSAQPSTWLTQPQTQDQPQRQSPSLVPSAVGARTQAQTVPQKTDTGMQWGFGVPESTPETSHRSGASANASECIGTRQLSSHIEHPTGKSPLRGRPQTTTAVLGTSSPQPLSAPVPQRSSPFVTPSRLRSPHPPISRQNKSGGRPSSGRGVTPSHPMQGIGVTLSHQQQFGGNGTVSTERTLQGFLQNAGDHF